ncbi:hypothetical protein ABZX75_26355 [Streptomyces sp. NPDC003038]|uniref:hypothetical protein n=1 Tax=unclassified Streptomyces TaxID=2593676 RepID=UPI0033A5B011
MIKHRTAAAFGCLFVSLGGGLAVAAPASAGGIGDLLSPAFGTSCANYNVGARANGAATQGTGTANGNLAGLPLGSALNHCGGADLADILMSTPRANDDGEHAFNDLVQLIHVDARENRIPVLNESAEVELSGEAE